MYFFRYLTGNLFRWLSDFENSQRNLFKYLRISHTIFLQTTVLFTSYVESHLIIMSFMGE